MAIRSYRSMLERAKGRLSYHIEKAKLDFVVSINRLAKERNLTKRDMAEALGCSPAFMTKILGGDQNLTIETMVKLARAVDGDLHIHVARRDSQVHWTEALASQPEQGVVSPATAAARDAWKYCANLTH